MALGQLIPVNALSLPTGTPHFTLTAAIVAADSAMTLTNGSVDISALPTYGNVRLLVYKTGDANAEYVDMTSRAGSVLQINRQVENADVRPKSNHAIGAGVWIVQTAAMVGGLALDLLTLGYNTIGASNESMVVHRDLAKKITVSQDGLLTGIEAYISASAAGLHTFMAALWTDNAGEIGDLVGFGPATGAILRGSHPDWVSIPVTYKLTGGVTYWIGFIWAAEGSGTTVSIYYDTGGADHSITDSVDNYVRSGAAGLSPANTTKNYSIRATFLPVRPAMVEAYAVIQDQKTAGTHGGTFTAGAWRTRDLNTIVTDRSGIVLALAANQFTLGPGRYQIWAQAPAFLVNGHQIRLRNITDGTTQIDGMNAHGQASTSVHTPAMLFGEFVLAANKVFEIQHQGDVTEATFGFGAASSGWAAHETYASVEIRRIGAKVVSNPTVTSARAIGSGAGDHTTTSTTLVNIHASAYDLVIDAVAGDILEIVGTLEPWYTGTKPRITFGMTVGGTTVDKVANHTPAVDGEVQTITFHREHIVTSGQIVAGTVTIRPQWRTTTGTARIENSGDSLPYFSVKNLRQ